MSNNSISTYKFKPFEFTVLEKNLNPQQHPLVRLFHQVVCNNGYLFSIGGYSTVTNDIPDQGASSTMQTMREVWKYSFDLGEWKIIKCQNLPYKLSSSPVTLSGNIIIIYGGTLAPFREYCSNRIYLGNLTNEYKENGMSFEELKVSGDVPLPLCDQFGVMHGKYINLIGGKSDDGYEMDVHRFDLSTRKWELLHKSLGEDEEEPDPRYLHDVVYYKGRVYIFGGLAEDGEDIIHNGFSEIHMFDVATKQWQLLPAKHDLRVPEPGYPSNRCWYGCVQCPEKSNLVYICGGFDYSRAFKDVWRFDIDTLQWEKLIKCIMPRPVYMHSTAVTPSGRICCYGGITTDDDNVDRRSNDITSAWIMIPKLKVICWEAMVYYFKEQMFKSSDECLKKIGLPQEYYERIIEARRIC